MHILLTGAVPGAMMKTGLTLHTRSRLFPDTNCRCPKRRVGILLQMKAGSMFLLQSYLPTTAFRRQTAQKRRPLLRHAAHAVWPGNNCSAGLLLRLAIRSLRSSSEYFLRFNFVTLLPLLLLW